MTVTEQRQDYVRELVVNAPQAHVLKSLTTLEGLAGWWAPAVSGDPTTGGEITFKFVRPDGVETKVMRVDESTDDAVIWTCLEDDTHRDWEGTRIVFRLAAQGGDRTSLRFRHEGLVPQLDCYLQCEAGWDRFMASIAAYAETGRGDPWRFRAPYPPRWPSRSRYSSWSISPLA